MQSKQGKEIAAPSAADLGQGLSAPARGGQDDARLVVFRLAGYEHALAVELVQEILTAADILPVVEAPPFVEGVIKLRGRIVPVIDLRKRLKLPASEWNYETCVVVASLEGILAGLVVDSVNELLSVPPDAVEPASDMVGGSRARFFEGAVHLDDRFLVTLNLRSLLTMDQQELIDHDALVIDSSPRAEGKVRRLGEGTQLGKFMAEDTEDEDEIMGGLVPVGEGAALGGQAFAMRKIIAFDLADELYGADIRDVAEILEPVPVRPLPNVPDHVLGLINLRGNIVPVVDLRVRFGLSRDKQWDKESRIIVLRQAGVLLGLVVDRMWELLRLPPEGFQPPPPDAAGIDAECLKEVGRIGDRLLIVLDVARLMRETAPSRALFEGGAPA